MGKEAHAEDTLRQGTAISEVQRALQQGLHSAAVTAESCRQQQQNQDGALSWESLRQLQAQVEELKEATRKVSRHESALGELQALASDVERHAAGLSDLQRLLGDVERH